MDKKKILVIDDDVLVLKSVKKFLLSKNFDVHCAKNGAEAEGIYIGENFDLVICDIRMPEDDGIAVIKKLKKMIQKNMKNQK